MTKIRKQHRKKKYKYNVNRKRMRNKLQKTPSIKCDQVNKEWERHKTVRQNLRSMGLAYDPNLAIRIPKTVIKPLEDEKLEEKPRPPRIPKKIHVAQALEEDANAPREKTFRLPKSQVQWLSYLLNKYGEDYKAMSRDDKNYYQETWKQLRAKVKQFKSIPEQFGEYLESREQKEMEINS
ncbi:nucleolar protein 16 [Lycorma delicatula]|uniref:nucleolar protein 16 n=1 Tax=Lycorma delicatula TaxID=130591 RepID=UPI003F50EF46